jgi:hypothetical protein
VKRNLKHFLLCLVATCVFISGNGIVLSIHTCFTKSVKNVSLFTEISCCKSQKHDCNPKAKRPQFNSKCCISEVSYHKINPNVLPQKFNDFSIPFHFVKTFSPDIIISGESISIIPFHPPARSVPLIYLNHQLLI